MSTSASIIKSADKLSILLSSTGDVATEQDTLGFEPYVESVARFLESPTTRPPLTIAVEGEWGSGKSSFMKMLRRRLCGVPNDFTFWQTFARERTAGTTFVKATWTSLRTAFQSKSKIAIEFNAWRNDKEEALWAAFALVCTRALRRSQPWYKKPIGWLRLMRTRLNGVEGATEILRFCGLAFLWIILVAALPGASYLHGLDWTKQEADKILEWSTRSDSAPASPKTTVPPSDRQTKIPEFVLNWVLRGGIFGTWAGLIVIGGKQLIKLGNPLEIRLDKVLRTPSYEGRLAFIEQFHEDFRKILDAYVGQNRVYVFIDDLDRCEVPKAAELMQAINLLIDDDPRLVFIIGMDRDKVAAGIVAKYDTILKYLNDGYLEPSADKLAFGYSYLEKFIQIQFRLPQPRSSSLHTFLADLAAPHILGSKPPWFRPFSQFPIQSPKTPSAPLGGFGAPTSDLDERTREIDRRAIELMVEQDSDLVQEVTISVAPIFDSNPRRLKQFINSFRLSALIASKLGLFDEIENKPGITFQQLGKFVAISLRWPDLLRALAADQSLLKKLYRQSIGNSKAQPRSWLAGNPRLKYLLAYGFLDSEGQKSIDSDRYSLESLDIDTLLTITPPVVRPAIATPPQASATSDSRQNKRAEMRVDEVVFKEPKETPDTLRGPLRPQLEKLARHYEQIRDTKPASNERTAEMTAIVRQARNLAGGMVDRQLRVTMFFMDGQQGDRIIALALAQGSPSTDYLPLGLEGILRSRSAFEQFHAISLVSRLVDELDDTEKKSVTAALQEPSTLKSIGDDASRVSLREQILKRLRDPVPRAQA